MTEELERMKLKQTVLEFVRSAGSEGVASEAIYEGVKAALPVGWSKERQLRLLGQVLDELHTEKAIEPKEQMWFAPNNY